MPFCPKCEQYYVDSTAYLHQEHKCPPVYECCVEGDDEWEGVFAYDYDQAAEKFSERLDDGSGEEAQERVILVSKPGDKRARKFKVTFEYRVDYTADEIEGVPDEEDEEE